MLRKSLSKKFLKCRNHLNEKKLNLVEFEYFVSRMFSGHLNNWHMSIWPKKKRESDRDNHRKQMTWKELVHLFYLYKTNISELINFDKKNPYKNNRPLHFHYIIVIFFPFFFFFRNINSSPALISFISNCFSFNSHQFKLK